MNLFYGLTISSLLVSMSQSVPVIECFNDPFSPVIPTDVRIEGCAEYPCILRRNDTFKIEFDFTLKQDEDIVKPWFLENYMNTYSTFLEYDEDLTCSGLKNASCPLKAGQNYTYANTMKIYAKSWPGLGRGRFVLYKGPNKGTWKVVCFDLPIFILKDDQKASEVNITLIKDFISKYYFKY